MLIARELELRPRAHQWPYAAWHALPEGILEPVCAALSPESMLDVLSAVPGINSAAVAGLKAHPKTSWLSRGLSELKSWWSAAQLDPNFDPEDSGEEDEDER